MAKKVTAGIIFLILIVIIVNLIKQISQAVTSGSRLDQEALELSDLQKQNQQLQIKLKSTRSFDFIEKIARNNLDLVQPGESVVIIPEGVIQQVLSQEKGFIISPLPNWQGWLRLLFH